MVFRIALLAFILVPATKGFADCIGLTSGPVVYDVTSCKSIQPKADFDPDQDYKFFQGLPPAERKKFLATYRGFVVLGKIVKSDAVEAGLSKKKGALAGKDLKLMIPADSGLSCNGILEKRLSGEINEACCTGVDTPCLLKTPYTLLSAKVVGTAASGDGDKTREAAKSSKSYQTGLAHYKKNKLKPAVKSLEKARKDNELDIKGHYLLGLIYRKLDDCRKAIPILETVFNKSEKDKVWADEEATVRRSNFLLARCYAMTNQPGRATIILNSYLVDLKNYRSEIKESLRHSDFGWINATKEYRDYTEAARKAMR
jgi:hypothetical protein